MARELTKLHEEVVRGRASEVLARLADSEPKGEVVLVLEGAQEATAPDVGELVGEAQALVAAGMKKRQAASEVARRYGASANDLYAALLRA
jgi:16S rRNA (cytidine1402-2'-O)-methyltransferase